MSKIEIFLDEDHFAKQNLKMSEDEKLIRNRKWIDIHLFIRKNLLAPGLISKITFNRWDRVMWGIYNNHRHELMMPSKFNKLFGNKPISLKYFKNAENKIKKQLATLNHGDKN